MWRTAFLTATVLVSPVAAQDAQSTYDELKNAFEAATEAAGKPPVEKFTPRFLKAAKAYEDGDAALPFLGWLLRNCTDPKARERVDAMIALRVKELVQSKTVQSKTVQSKTDGGEPPAAWAKRAYRQWSHTWFRRRSGATDADVARDLTLLRAIAAAATDQRTKEGAAGAAFEIERLQIGMVAPDIAGKDIDGVAFKLSDYRGKVIVLDFWGDW